MAFLENRQSLGQHQQQVITPGLVQMVNLLVLNKVELVDRIADELSENPVLEEGTEVLEAPDSEAAAGEGESPEDAPEALDEGLSQPEAGDDDTRDFDLQEFERYLQDSASSPREREVIERPSFEAFLSRPSTLTDHLEWQLGLAPLDGGILEACRSIIGNLNDDGCLAAVDEKGREVPISLEEIAESGRHSLRDVERALIVVQGFDPVGVAARDLRECLLIQLSRLEQDEPVAIEIVTRHLRDLQNHKFKEVGRSIGRPLEDVLRALDVIKSLDPRPGQRYNSLEARHIEPDVFFMKAGHQYTVVTNEDEMPQLRLSQTYSRMLEKGVVDKETKTFVKDRFRSALQLLKNIEQRKNIIVKVCESILAHQSAFLDNGIDSLAPMMIKDVADEVGVHPGTVSRAVANKFAHTPQGVLPLRFFFSEAVNTTFGPSISLTRVRVMVKRLVEGEDPRQPLTDDRIAQILKREGISVTRRSITKYREDLKIPSTHQRRQRI